MNDQLQAYEEKKLQTILDIHCPINSWFALTIWCDLDATALLIETASISHNIAIAKALEANVFIQSYVKFGTQKDGSFHGIASTGFINGEKSLKKCANREPKTNATKRFGIFLKYFLINTATAKVKTQTIIVKISKFSTFENIIFQVSKNSVHLSTDTHKTLFIWLVTINIAAHAVKPITTVCETKSTTFQSFNSQNSSWYTQAKNVKINANWINFGLQMKSEFQASEKLFIVLNITKDIAVVGQEIRCLDDQNIAAISKE